MKPSLACAIYTRKSSEDGLEQDFNSLDAQREACEAFILSQKQEGWRALPESYDDGGYSGGTMNRPALQRLLADIATRRVQVVVVYKVDRLTRSLADFAKIVERFDAHGVSFVSVTQQFNTTSSMGRLTLNVLLSFAQFEREVTGERIRDKIAASKKKGLWMGGVAPVGYRSQARTLVIDESQADRIREIFRLYLDLGCVRRLKTELDRRGWITPPRKMTRANASGERAYSRGHLYRILSNPVYLGKIAHKGIIYPGQHPAIIDEALWNKAQGVLADGRRGTQSRLTAKDPSPLAGLVFDDQGQRLTATHACKGKRRYRYYVSHHLVGQIKVSESSGLRIPAQELEDAIRLGLVGYLGDPSRVMAEIQIISPKACQDLMTRLKAMIATLESGSSRERMGLFATLIERVAVRLDGIEISMKQSAFDPEATGKSVVIRCPVQFMRCGFGIRLIIQTPGTPRPGVVDHRLVRLVDRGIGWFNRMAGKEALGIGAIARAEGVTPSFVIRLAYLAFLAPDIVDSIRRGTHPATLTVDRLTRSTPLPMRWDAQRHLLGFAPATA